jgi:hypothetical protein
VDFDPGSNAMKVIRTWGLDGCVTLGYNPDELGAVRVLVEEANRALSADRKWKDRVWKNDRVPKRQNRNAVVDLGFRYYRLFLVVHCIYLYVASALSR